MNAKILTTSQTGRSIETARGRYSRPAHFYRTLIRERPLCVLLVFLTSVREKDYPST